LAAAAAASGMTLTKDISVLDGSSVGSRNINGSAAISTPFTNLGPTDSHTAGVGPTPRVSVLLYMISFWQESSPTSATVLYFKLTSGVHFLSVTCLLCI
jgi:hypothetical protein